VLAPLVLGPAQPADAEDQYLAFAGGDSVLVEDVGAEDAPALQEFRVRSEGAVDVENAPVARCVVHEVASLVVEI
jgi:hypothetical protein